jgi:hypothetical protein
MLSVGDWKFAAACDEHDLADGAGIAQQLDPPRAQTG